MGGWVGLRLYLFVFCSSIFCGWTCSIFLKIIFLFFWLVLLLDFFLFFVGGPVFFIYFSIFLWMDEADIYDDPNYDDVDDDDEEEEEDS